MEEGRLPFFSRIINRFRPQKKSEQRSTLSNPAEWLVNFYGNQTTSGESVTPTDGVNIGAIYTSSKIIGETLGTLTFNVHKKRGESREVINNGVNFLLSNSPDPIRGVTAFDFWVTVGLHLCTWGNFYALIIRNQSTMQPDRLVIQSPTLDSGSEWFENTKGDKSRAGMLTLVIGGEEKWDYIKVIR